MPDHQQTPGGLSVQRALLAFVDGELLPDTGLDRDAFWRDFADIVHEMTPRNRALLEERERLQAEIDTWHRRHRHGAAAPSDYEAFLREIGYLVEEAPAGRIETRGLDPEVSTIAGPQLVVPVSNARYALNAANARWGSLYDALYGTDALGTPAPEGPYDPRRGAAVVEWVMSLLDEIVPLQSGSHAHVTAYAVEDGELVARTGCDTSSSLLDQSALAGYAGRADDPSSVLLRRHGLHLELRIDRGHRVGRASAAGVADVLVESALTAIMDCEDSVAAVDVEDKVVVYRNWLRLMQGTLTADVSKQGRTFTRRLVEDRAFCRPDGTAFTLPGRALLFIRNVGLHMTTDAVLDGDGHDVPEGIVDAVVTAAAAMHDLRGSGQRNSKSGAVYVVKPKMHGPDEVAFTDELFGRVEALLGLPPNTVKLGLMDEERRTSANLAACIAAVTRRVAFVNTGFLDRTGDEIHTSMEAGPVVPKAAMKREPWFEAYETRNVAIALARGFRGRAQIGKGMWAAPDDMADMLQTKVEHPLSGATCAWVPSPAAATLHATHYFQVDVEAHQRLLECEVPLGLSAMLRLPLASAPASGDDRMREIENNAQGILGYVVRWVTDGIGCSKVPDIHGTPLMEDRATCRISAQHIANWLAHGVVTREEVADALRRMAAVVDAQNSGDPDYVPMSPGFDGNAFRAACELVFEGARQPAGYTEPILHGWRRRQKGGRA